jgi:hypothetical protein
VVRGNGFRGKGGSGNGGEYCIIVFFFFFFFRNYIPKPLPTLFIPTQRIFFCLPPSRKPGGAP